MTYHKLICYYREQYIIHIYLGKSVEEVQQSAQILQNWFTNADNEAFIYTSNPNGDKVCLYKYYANMYASYGTEVNCKSTRIIFGTDMMQALAGGYAASAAADKQRLIDNLAFGEHVLTGLCSFKMEFMKSIKNFKG